LACLKSKLLQKAGIIFEEHTEIIDLVSQHGDTFDTHTEGEAAVFFRINTAG
jgi:hypothetical protein